VAYVVILFLVTGRVPLVLLVALLILCYLTAIELRHEDDPVLIKAWWVLLVLLTNVLGYAAFRIWLAARRRRRSA
jgi:TctA family transporter